MDFAEAYLMTKLGHPALAGWWGKLLGGGGGGSAGSEYGVEWDYSDPSPKLTRTGDAKGLADPVPATSLAVTGTSPFDQIMPWAGMKMCNIINGEVAYWHGDPQFSETAYDTMVYIPPFWYKAEKDTSTSKWRWLISPSEKEGYAKHPGSGRYIGRYHSSGSSAAVFSKSDAMPLVSKTRANFRSYSHNKGAKWWMLDLATWSAVQMLYLVEFADFNSQGVLGGGQNSGSVISSGDTDGAVYHTLQRTGASNQYRWIEDPWSNVYDFVDGFVAIDGAAYVGLDNAVFGDTSNALTATGITLPSTGYITDFGYSPACLFAFVPSSASGGSGTTYVPDRVASDSGTTTLLSGNYQKVVYGGGLFYFGSNNVASFTFASLGSRLIFIP